jgi:hypothetical protein
MYISKAGGSVRRILYIGYLVSIFTVIKFITNYVHRLKGLHKNSPFLNSTNIFKIIV